MAMERERGSHPTGVEENPVLMEVAAWEGVTLHDGERGEVSVRFGKVEIGHMHGKRVAHFGFPKPLWRELIAEGIVEPHPLRIEGWAERRIRDAEDQVEVVDLFRLNYDRMVARGSGDRTKGEGSDV